MRLLTRSMNKRRRHLLELVRGLLPNLCLWVSMRMLITVVVLLIWIVLTVRVGSWSLRIWISILCIDILLLVRELIKQSLLRRLQLGELRRSSLPKSQLSLSWRVYSSSKRFELFQLFKRIHFLFVQYTSRQKQRLSKLS